MFKRSITLFINVFLLLSFAYAEENYTISGDVSFQYDGDIYVCLCTKEEYRELTQDYKLSRPQCKLVRMNTELKKARKVLFSFDGIPKGTYGILTFQDVNKNGKLDFSGKIYDEPVGSYKELPPWQTYFEWGAIKFDLERDITGIKIHM